MIKILLCCLMPGIVLAQSSTTNPGPATSWGYGLGVGNGLALHLGYFRPHLVALGRARGKWWQASNETDGGLFGDPDLRAQQTEVAALLGFPIAVGDARLYVAAGLGYVAGRHTGEYRYTIRKSGLLSEPKNFYAHRTYQALGVPLEGGLISKPLGVEGVRVGIAAQANLNPQQSVFCLLATVWFGNPTTNSIKKHE